MEKRIQIIQDINYSKNGIRYIVCEKDLINVIKDTEVKEDEPIMLTIPEEVDTIKAGCFMQLPKTFYNKLKHNPIQYEIYCPNGIEFQGSFYFGHNRVQIEKSFKDPKCLNQIPYSITFIQPERYINAKLAGTVEVDGEKGEYSIERDEGKTTLGFKKMDYKEIKQKFEERDLKFKNPFDYGQEQSL